MFNYSDVRERKLIIRFFATTGAITTFVMACVALADHNYLLFSSLIASAVLFILPWFIKNHDRLSSWVVLYTLYLLMIFLVFTGGSQGTGPIWIFIVSPVTFFIRGLKKGVIDISFFIIAVVGAYFCAKNFDGYQYQQPQLLLRLILSFIIVALLSGFYEYFRENYSKRLIQLAKANEVLATTDPLTSLPNRRYTMKRLADEKRLSDKSAQPLSIMLIDVDDFKKINDGLGHQVGDIALVHLADVFRKFSRETDVFCRWGGEEFLCILPQTSALDATELAKRIQKDLADTPVSFKDSHFQLKISVGISDVNTPDTIDDAIKKADDNLYLAKTTGKNKVCVG